MAPLVELPIAVSVRIKQWLKRLKGGWRSDVEVFPLHAPRGRARVARKKRHDIRRSIAIAAYPERSSRAISRERMMSIPPDRCH